MAENDTPPGVGAGGLTDEKILPVAGGADADSGKGLFGQLGNAVADFAERRGLVIKGRGRPKNCRDCGGVGCAACGGTGKIPGKGDKVVPPASVVPAAASLPPVAALDTPPAAPVANSKADSLFVRSILSTVRGAIRGALDYGRSLARQAGFEHGWVKENFDRAEPNPDDLKEFGEGLELCAEKYQWKTEYGPEIATISAGCRLAAPIGILLWELRAELKRKRQGGKP